VKHAAIFGLCLVLGGGCKKQSDAPPPPDNRGPAIPEAELKRGKDACNGYVTKLCTCAETVPAAKDKCDLARALPEAIDVAMQVTMSKDSAQLDVKQAADSIRKTVAQCIEQTAQLPALGCN
jgi:hypothetical protein